MENNDYGLLYDAAVAWKELTEYYYVLHLATNSNCTQFIYHFHLKSFHILQAFNI